MPLDFPPSQARPVQTRRIDPAYVKGALFQRLWAKAYLSVLMTRQGIRPYDHARGIMGTWSGAPSIVVDPVLGPSFLGGGTNERLEWPTSRYTFPEQRDFTAVCLFRMDLGGRLQGLVKTTVSTGAEGIDLVMLDTNECCLNKAAIGTVFSGIFLTVGVPYFFACTYQHGTGAAQFLSKRLDTGATVISSATDTRIYSVLEGGAMIGSYSTFAFAGRIAGAYMGNVYIGADGLRLWANDPWGLWRESRYVAAWEAVAAAGGGGGKLAGSLMSAGMGF